MTHSAQSPALQDLLDRLLTKKVKPVEPVEPLTDAELATYLANRQPSPRQPSPRVVPKYAYTPPMPASKPPADEQFDALVMNAARLPASDTSSDDAEFNDELVTKGSF